MSIEYLNSMFQKLTDCTTWSILLLRITSSRRIGVQYSAREIYLRPTGRLSKFISEITSDYVGNSNAKMFNFTDVLEYDGEAVDKVIYKMSTNNILIKDSIERLFSVIANPTVENNLNDFNFDAYVLNGSVKIYDEKLPIKLVSIKNPITSFKNRFYYDENTFKEINQKVLYLRTSIDVVIVDDHIYLFTSLGEKLFDMERTYKLVCKEKVQEILSSNIIYENNSDIFIQAATSRHNPRKFLSFNQDRLEKLKDVATLTNMAGKYSIPVIDNKFYVSDENAAEKIIKLLCNKGMMDPFEDAPVEVTSSKRWN